MKDEDKSKPEENNRLEWQIYAEIFLVRSVMGLGMYYTIYLRYYFIIPVVFVLFLMNIMIEKKLFSYHADMSNPNVIQSYITSEGTLPSWVMYPDVERTAWLNEIIRQMWPFINNYFEKYCIGKKIKGVLVNSFSMGDIPPYFCGIKFYAGHNITRRSFVMDIGIIYAGNAVISGHKKGYKVGIADIGISGKLRFQFEPLITNPPFIGGISATMVPSPKLMFTIFDMFYLSKLPIIGDIINSRVRDLFFKYYVFPNKKEISIAKRTKKNQERTLAEGVLLIHINTVEDIKHNLNRSTIFRKQLIPEIYVELVVGSSEFKTKIAKGDMDIEFDEYFEAIITKVDEQVLLLKLRDKNQASKRDECMVLSLESICKKGRSRTKLDYCGFISGTIGIEFVWKTLSDSHLGFTKQSRNLGINAHSSNGFLSIYLDSAARLSNIFLHKGKTINVRGDPSPIVKLSCNQQETKSDVCHSTGNPIWQQSFEFIVKSVETDSLRIKIEDSVTNLNLGKLVIPFYQLMKAPNMILNQPFLFSDGANESYIFMKLILKALVVKDIQNMLEDTLSGDKETLGQRLSGRISIWRGEAVITRSITSLEEEIDELDADDGKIRVTLNYKAIKEFLNITIHSAINIVPGDTQQRDLPDSFVRLRILPNDLRKSRTTTKLCLESAHPIFNENFQVFIPRNYVTNETTFLGLYILNTKNKKLLGVASISLNDMDLDKPTTLWYPITTIEDVESHWGSHV